MTAAAVRPAPRGAFRRLGSQRWKRRLTTRGDLISVAGSVGNPVLDGSGRRVGSLDDLVISSDGSNPHPALEGALIRRHTSRSFVPVDDLAELMPDRLLLKKTLGGPAVELRPSHVKLMHDVVDRQIVDMNGVDITRVSDLVLARLSDGLHLVGADFSARTLLRRLGPAVLRRCVARDRVYDWSAVAPLADVGGADSVLRLREAGVRLDERTLAEPAPERAP